MTPSRRRRAGKAKPTLRTARYDVFASALGRSVESAEVQAVLEMLGPHAVRRHQPSVARYDPDGVRTVTWDFPTAPPATRWDATNLGIRDDTVVWLMVARELVNGQTSGQPVWFRLPDDAEELFRSQGDEWNWAPAIVRRRGELLLDLDVPQGHWDGSYRFPLTALQAERMQADALLYREVWEGLVRVCRRARLVDDPTMLPAAAQSLIDARCGQG